MATSTERFRAQLAAYRTRPDPEPVDLLPASTYEAVTRQMVESLAEDLREIKSRLNGLIFLMAGAIVLDGIGRLLGQ